MLVRAWVAIAPTPASAWGTRSPTAEAAVHTHTPRAKVFGHRATIENVVGTYLLFHSSFFSFEEPFYPCL